MKRTDRCPWCGKIMNRHKDKRKLSDRWDSSVPSRLRLARCRHCGHKYGQIPTFPYVYINIIIAFLLLLGCFWVIYELEISVWFALFPMMCVYYLFRTFTPYSKLNDRGRQVDINNDMLCCALIIETYGKIKCNEIYFLSDDFDLFEPYTLASPIHVYHINKKEKYVTGEFLYMHEKNYNYIDKDVCELYDSNMKLIAKVKITTDIE